MNERELEPAIARLLMLTASALDEAEAEAVEVQLARFDGPESMRPLIYVLVVQVTEKMPDGGALMLADDGDIIALGLIQAGQAFGLDNLRELIRDIPEVLLPIAAVSLLGMWRSACEQATVYELRRAHVPDYPTTEGSR